MAQMMNLEDLAVWGFMIAIAALIWTTSSIRQMLIAATSLLAGKLDDVERVLGEVERTVEGLERRLRRLEPGYIPPE